jgi:hypothetical protein
MKSNSKKRNKSFVKPTSIAQRRLVFAISVFVVLAFGALNPLYLLGFTGIFIGELLRFSTFALRFARQLASRMARIVAEEKEKDLAAENANKSELMMASARQIDELTENHALTIIFSRISLPALVERLQASMGGVAHVSLTSRLLPTPFSAC